jgi:hypothetical protein
VDREVVGVTEQPVCRRRAAIARSVSSAAMRTFIAIAFRSARRRNRSLLGTP